MRTLALPELLECYLRSRNNDPLKNPLDKRDENNTKRAFALLAECFPLTDSSQIDREALEKFQIFLVQKVGKGGMPFSRTYCNTIIKFVRTVFYWATTQKPPIIAESRAFFMSKVRALKPSPKIRENKRRKNVPVVHVTDAQPYLFPMYADMLQLQLLHGMRPSEVCFIKPCLIDFNHESGNWLYQPDQHKTAAHGVERNFFFCRTSQAILQKYMPDDPNQFFFLTRRKTPVSVAVLGRNIKRAIEKNGLEKFTPYQIRHTIATWINGNFDEKHAQEFLGHTTPEMTRNYIHDKTDKIQRVAEALDTAFAAAVPGEPQFAPFPPTLRIFTGD